MLADQLADQAGEGPRRRGDAFELQPRTAVRVRPTRSGRMPPITPCKRPADVVMQHRPFVRAVGRTVEADRFLSQFVPVRVDDGHGIPRSPQAIAPGRRA